MAMTWGLVKQVIEFINTSRETAIKIGTENAHEDFMFVREFSMSSREEHLDKIKEVLTDGTNTWHLRVECIHEDDHVLVMRSTKVDRDGSEIITNNVSIKKGGLYWRTIINEL